MRDHFTIPNQHNVTVKITRGELCRLLVVCCELSRESESWKALHEKLAEQLDKHDKAYKESYDI